MSKLSRRLSAQRSVLACLTAGAVASGALAAVPAAQAAEESPGLTRADRSVASAFESGRYVVVLEEASATRYEGGAPGFERTKARGNKEFNPRSAAVRKYVERLEAKQDRLAAKVGAEVGEHYTLASNAFTAKLSGKQAGQLAADREVLLLTEDVAYEHDTWNTPDFLGLTGPNGVWAQHGGSAKAGDGVVIADLDTGTWPESPSFAGAKIKREPTGKWGLHRQGKSITMRKADGGTFTGVCETGQDWTVNDCNTKLVGARYYPDAFLETVAPADRAPTEYISARDGGGHGTHTASTAAGNNGVEVSVEGTDFGAVSGVAPAAKIATYKVCFEDNDPNTGGCYTSSTLAAVEDVIRDGADILTYSISGARDTVVDPVEYAFAGAAAAGIFVTASAGNSGPGPETVAHNSPWVTTVGASTHTVFENTLVLGDGTKLNGPSIASNLPDGEKPLVASKEVKLSSADLRQAALCYPGTLDPAKVAGKIVVCDRGDIARVDKSAEVQRAGGVGMVLANTAPASLNTDFHSVPTVHLDHVDGQVVADYLVDSGSSAVASFERGDTTGGPVTPVPQMAAFSSRGPALANDADVIKPDLTAPGVSILAAVAPPSNNNRDYDLYSGTSMSTPHVAGLAAMILAVNPDWDPMTVKSAMMTTAYDVKGAAGDKFTDPFAQGAGHVDPTRFFEPGLAITSDSEDWAGFLQGQGLDLGVDPLAASDLNGPSIAQGQVTAETTISRTFTGLQSGTWSVSSDLPGFTVDHKPEVSIASAGETATVDFTFTRTTAPLGEFAKGFVTLEGPTTVRIPVALRPVSVKAPATVQGQGAEGSVTVPITAGFTGDLEIGTVGLAESAFMESTVPAGDYEALKLPVAAGTQLARFDLDAADDKADLDLYVYSMKADGSLDRLVGRSATGSADESVTLENPKPGTYYIVVDGYAAAPGQSAIDYRLDAFRVDGSATAGNLAADPNPVPVVTGVETSFEATWSGLDAGSRYLGWFEYDGALAPTYLYVN